LYADAQVQRATAAMWEKGIREGILDGWGLRQEVTGTTVLPKDPTDIGRLIKTYADLGAMITSMYQNAENLDLPIGWVVEACFAISRGETTRESVLLELMRQLRDKLNNPLTETDPLPSIEL
jgi:hypothetical protein